VLRRTVIDSRYRRFAPARIEAHADGSVDAYAADGSFVRRLSITEYALAQLFDGQRNAAARVAVAQRGGAAPGTELLEGVAAELAEQRLLQAGTHEPLPPPPHDEREVVALGWTGLRPAFAGGAAAALPPSSIPGSRVSPGLTGGLTGLVTGRRGQANQIDTALDARPFVLLGRLLLWPVYSRWHLLLFCALGALAVAIAR
jgi:putative peptide zinc metalloprotease protein